MPKIGEVQLGRDIGKGAINNSFIWQACEDCGKERWVTLTKGIPKSTRCYPCSVKYQHGDGNSRWNGGHYKIWSGYIMVTLKPDDFFYPMCKQGHVQEHRLTMAKHLNRCLLPWEVVHHRNGIRDDNRLENLQLLPTQSYHVSDTQIKQYVLKLEARIKVLEARVTLIEAENAVLKSWQEDSLRISTR